MMFDFTGSSPPPKPPTKGMDPSLITPGALVIVSYHKKSGAENMTGVVFEVLAVNKQAVIVTPTGIIPNKMVGMRLLLWFWEYEFYNAEDMSTQLKTYQAMVAGKPIENRPILNFRFRDGEMHLE